jgi:hypothetical protein
MKIKIKVEKEVEAVTLHVEADVRYWENATVNGKEDSEGTLIPCRDKSQWKPVINIDQGKIINWAQGIEASVHYKVCDEGNYFVKDKDGNTLLSIEDHYVPSIMCPTENGYGDYIIMEIESDGMIKNWKADLSSFIQDAKNNE